MRYLSKMERSCWRGKQRSNGKGARLCYWLFLKEEQRWLYRRLAPTLVRIDTGIYHRYIGFTYFSAVDMPNVWPVPPPP